MLHDQQLDEANAVQRKMYTSLTEVAELTSELSEAVNRQDQVSVRMFLSMRQEEIGRLNDYQAMLNRQCKQLPAEDGALLSQYISGRFSGKLPTASGEALLRQAEKNYALLERVRQADRAVSSRLGGANSFYMKQGK